MGTVRERQGLDQHDPGSRASLLLQPVPRPEPTSRHCSPARACEQMQVYYGTDGSFLNPHPKHQPPNKAPGGSSGSQRLIPGPEPDQKPSTVTSEPRPGGRQP